MTPHKRGSKSPQLDTFTSRSQRRRVDFHHLHHPRRSDLDDVSLRGRIEPELANCISCGHRPATPIPPLASATPPPADCPEHDAIMASSPQDSVRQRKDNVKKAAQASTFSPEPELDKLAKAAAQKAAAESGDLDYKLGLVLITILAFVTRFWGISHPNEVVFDEVHFGKVRTQRRTERQRLTAAVRLVLSRKDLLLRRPPPVRQAPLCLYGLDCRL